EAAVIAVRAPSQLWSAAGGDLAGQAIHGIYHGDVRHVRELSLTCAGSPVEWISVSTDGPSRVVFGGILRGLDDRFPDPKVRLLRERVLDAGRVTETWTVHSRVAHAIDTELVLRVVPDFASLHDVKSGLASAERFTIQATDDGAAAASGRTRFVLSSPGAAVSTDDDAITATWPVAVSPFGSAAVRFTIEMTDAALVVQAPLAGPHWDAAAVSDAARPIDPRLARWLDRALGDLDALRLALPDHPGDDFFAAGAPWFLTLFGRDSLWAARLALPLDTRVAASTLRVLARLQADDADDASAREPGKILHELRATTLEMPGEGISLPPLYYGSVDSTPLWVCLLADARRAGMPDDEVRELLPALRRALGWILDHGDSDGDGFLDYVDRTGSGLANQGWKDSGDSIQWRDGSLAEGPIALCEVQAYAYEAVLAGAELLDELGDDGDSPATLRAWAAALRARFAESFWITTPEGRYPAVALDRDKRPVDTLTSNIGHLIGTGILDAADEADVARLLLSSPMSSGYGIRTMSTGAGGYWPLSYHGGSVWTHDTAIVAHGMLRAGLGDQAREVVTGMLAAAEGFAYRVPELHSGDPIGDTTTPTPYPAACRPQAWSAAAAITALSVLSA
ncbi:glycogen debranching N-terminal domain-containing protein, partial [Planococcus sp. APC 4015]|nr:glycogen debranching N-terminal domain-containing protein [Planococcus sp. APC 4015]